MGKDRRPWRKLVKKLRRKRIRSESARKRNEALQVGSGSDSDESDSEAESRRASELKYLEREKEAQDAFEERKAEERRKIQLEEEERARIRQEWEELQAKQEAYRKETEEKEAERKEKQVLGNPLKNFENVFEHIPLQEKEFNEFLDFLAGDIETPPVPYLIPDDLSSGDKAVCPFFVRTAACRFGVQCTRLHPKPTLSQILLIPNFFSHFSLEQTLRDEYDTDLNLEYEDSELYREFLVFYYDVLPEFQKFGNVIQFKVCCNFEAHLRGNVYVQFKDIRQAVEAYRNFNGRFFNGRQLSLQFVKIESWRSAICGLFCRKRCPKKRTCSYLHVFRNPTKEFVPADNDWKPAPQKASASHSNVNNSSSSKNNSTPRSERSRSDSRTNSTSRRFNAESCNVREEKCRDDIGQSRKRQHIEDDHRSPKSDHRHREGKKHKKEKHKHKKSKKAKKKYKKKEKEK